MFADGLLVILAAVLAYAWLVYPLLLKWLARRRALAAPPAPPVASLPRVAVLLAAYNEEAVIARRVRNLLALDYPVERLSVYLGVDGATDGTAHLAQSAAAGLAHIRVMSFAGNRGKVAVLKDLVAQTLSAAPAPDLLVFTDANTFFAPDALRVLARPFADPAVGGVCGRLVFVDGTGSETGEGTYWLMETRLKDRESRLDSCLGANGAIYAIRAGLFPPQLPDNTIIDDFVIGMKVREAGQRMVYEPGAVAREELPATVGDEWVRRVRIGAGDYQALALCRRCLAPAYGVFAWLFWSHKVLRWFTPHMLVGLSLLAWGRMAVVGARGGLGALLGPGGALATAAGTTLAVCGAAALGGRYLAAGTGRGRRVLRLCHYFVVMQAALLAGFCRFCRGGLEGRWSRTRRAPAGDGA